VELGGLRFAARQAGRREIRLAIWTRSFGARDRGIRGIQAVFCTGFCGFFAVASAPARVARRSATLYAGSSGRQSGGRCAALAIRTNGA